MLVVDLLVHGDSRGWFKENWQRAKMVALGLPDFRPVQQNMSFNAEAGVTRGLHAEPWDKLIGLAKGRIFGAWVDLRPGETFGASFTLEMGRRRSLCREVSPTVTRRLNQILRIPIWSMSTGRHRLGLLTPI